MSDVVVYEDKAPVKRKQGQQPKWEKWVKKMDEVLNRNHPVGYAIVYNDEMLLAVVGPAFSLPALYPHRQPRHS